MTMGSPEAARFGESRHSFVIDDTPAALDLVGSGRVKGKIVVSVAPVPEGRS